jgi:catechol 2,3-dioxygenase-like lactoylglutathione lyase family enzyme
MRQSILHVALVVRDYDEAIAFFTGRLGFTLVEASSEPPGRAPVPVLRGCPEGAGQAYWPVESPRAVTCTMKEVTCGSPGMRPGSPECGFSRP